jgi:hypothetical protein
MALCLGEPRYFFFVIAIQQGGVWTFTRYTPTEFMGFSNIPPFKIFFNIPDALKQSVPKEGPSKSLRLSQQNLKDMIALYDLLKNPLLPPK